MEYQLEYLGNPDGLIIFPFHVQLMFHCYSVKHNQTYLNFPWKNPKAMPARRAALARSLINSTATWQEKMDEMDQFQWNPRF
jgi:hypothetical protein